jgi:O-antigen/teichoic acid export membrane protein
MTLINNTKWVAVSQFSRVGLQLLGMLFLARLLGPADYGVMAMAMIVVNLANLLRDLGTSAAVVQRDELDENAKATVFWLNFGVGLTLSALVAGLATLIGYIFVTPNLPKVLWWKFYLREWASLWLFCWLTLGSACFACRRRYSLRLRCRRRNSGC